MGWVMRQATQCLLVLQVRQFHGPHARPLKVPEQLIQNPQGTRAKFIRHFIPEHHQKSRCGISPWPNGNTFALDSFFQHRYGNIWSRYLRDLDLCLTFVWLIQESSSSRHPPRLTLASAWLRPWAFPEDLQPMAQPRFCRESQHHPPTWAAASCVGEGVHTWCHPQMHSTQSLMQTVQPSQGSHSRMNHHHGIPYAIENWCIFLHEMNGIFCQANHHQTCWAPAHRWLHQKPKDPHDLHVRPHQPVPCPTRHKTT